MKILGYSDSLSVAPGEKIRFMVSCELPSYRADIVRLIHGDPSPKGPGFKEEVIETSISGEHRGRKQAIYSGSYATAPDNPLLKQIKSFTLQAWIYPTTPEKGVQGILTKWSSPDNAGYGLFIDEDGSIALWIGDGDGRVERLRTGKSLRASQWYFVAGIYDDRSGKVSLYQEPLTAWPLDDSKAIIESSAQIKKVGERHVSFLMAGYWERGEGGKRVVKGHFNGKIDAPCLFGRALSRGEIVSLKRGTPPEDIGGELIASWDFAKDISSKKVTDRSSHGLHGQTVNMPMRAATGHNWRGNETNFNHAPSEYGAIYFHDDDIDDAGWEADFELIVPAYLRSGVYAARLRSEGSEDHIPFFVRPKKGSPSARILFIAPTNTYIAYANEHLEDIPIEITPNQNIDLHKEEYRYIADNRLSSLYDRHTDGSGFCYASRLLPILNMRPKHYSRLQNCPRHFSADLYLLYWMEAKGYKFDVVADEDLHFEGGDLLAPYKVVVTGTHPEYPTGQMIDALEAYLKNGGRLMYLGGNGFYWITSFDAERPHIIEVRRWGGSRSWEAAPGEYYHSTTGELGGLWRFRGKAPQKLVGVGFTAQGFDRNSPYYRQAGSFDPRAAFIFEGVRDDEVIGNFESFVLNYGAAGDEIDRMDHDLGTPHHALLLASSYGHSNAYQHVVEEVQIADSKQGGKVNPLVRADMVYFECPAGGAVFSTGSISWCGALLYNNCDNNVSRITENVLKRFASDYPL